MQGWPAVHAQLAVRDPEAAARIAPNDAQRIQRAIEVLQLSGQPLHAHWTQAAGAGGWLGRWEVVKLEPASRAQLHAQLASRLDAMLSQGLVDEVRALLARSTLREDSPVRRLVGYRQLIEYCRGAESLENAALRALQATRQLAKRQLTWLRSATMLPEGVCTATIDAFDAQARERLALTLIKAEALP
jgi:tRNA dimethylallyltransferase